MNSKSVAIILSACVAVVGWTPSVAGTYPDRAIDMIVSFPAGGITDTIARVLAGEMSTELGQTLVPMNKTGASGTIGTSAIARAPKDGYNLGFIASAALTTVPHIQDVAYSPESFDYICRAFSVPVLLLAAPDSPFNSVADVIDYAKSNPGKLNYATPGSGSIPHLAALEFLQDANIKMTHIPYKGEGPSVMALLGKQVDLYYGTIAAATAHNLKKLAAASATRMTQAPGTPTFTELGYKVDWSVMGGLIAPKGISDAARKTLGDTCAQAVKQPRYASSLKSLQVTSAYLPGDDFHAIIDNEYAKSKLLMKNAGLSVH